MEKSEFDQISKDYIDQNKKLSSEELIHLSYEALLKHDPNIMEVQNMLRAGELMMGKGRSNQRHFEKLWWVVCEFWEYEEDKEAWSNTSRVDPESLAFLIMSDENRVKMINQSKIIKSP